MQKKNIEILFEDSYLIVILKPEGLLSVPYQGSNGKSAIEILEKLMRKKGTWSKNRKPLAVHRLDRDTSGVMMFALNERAQKKIMDNWHTLVTGRIYRALAENPPSKKNTLPESGTIEDSLAYNAKHIGFVPKKMEEDNQYKNLQHHKNSQYAVKNERKPHSFKTISARTHYTIIKRGKNHTLFELNLDTGRKNQIRAHLASKGYPICGDDHYSAKTNPFNRLTLHARTLEFVHPFSNEHLQFEVPEPKEWLDFCQYSTTPQKTVF